MSIFRVSSTLLHKSIPTFTRVPNSLRTNSMRSFTDGSTPGLKTIYDLRNAASHINNIIKNRDSQHKLYVHMNQINALINECDSNIMMSVKIASVKETMLDGVKTAIRNGDIDCMTKLVKHDWICSHINLDDYIEGALKGTSDEILELLLKMGETPIPKAGLRREGLMVLACESGRISFIELMLKYKYPVTDYSFGAACKMNLPNHVLQVLLDSGYKPSEQALDRMIDLSSYVNQNDVVHYGGF